MKSKVGLVLPLVGTAAVFALMMHTAVDVTTRALFNSPASSTLEYVKYWYLPMISSIGIMVAYADRSHVSVPLLYLRASESARMVMDTVRWLFTIVVFVPLSYFGFTLAVEKMRVGEYHATTLAWPGRFLIPALAAYATVYTIGEVIARVRGAQAPPRTTVEMQQ